MALKRHITGKPIGQEYEASDDSELESEREEEEPKNVKRDIQIRPIERDITKPSSDAGHLKRNNTAEVLRRDLSEEEGEERSKSESEVSSDEESSEEESSDEESSDEEPQILKPVFLSKTKRTQPSSITAHKSKDQKALEDRERTLKTIETHINQDIEYQKQLKESTQNYGEIDDTDDIDPEAERAEWELRQLKREQRDRAKLEKEQDELEDLENRRLRTEKERDEEYKQQQQQQQEEPKEVDESKWSKPQGAFFRDEALLSRDLGEENEKYDKSLLPQRFKPERL